MDPNNQSNPAQNQVPNSEDQTNPAPANSEPAAPVQPEPGVTEASSPANPTPTNEPTTPPTADPTTSTTPTVQPTSDVVSPPTESAEPQPTVQPQSQPAPEARQPAQSQSPSGFTGGVTPDTKAATPPSASSPAPQPMPLGGLEQANSKKPSAKLVTIILAVVAALAILGVGGWFAYSHLFNRIPLKTYQGDGYSVLVPTDYKQESGLSGVDFKEPDTNKDTQSGEEINSIDFPTSGVSRDKVIQTFDKSLSEKSASNIIDAGGKVKDYKFTKTTADGLEARKITATVEKEGKKIGSFYELVVFGQKKIYVVVVVAHAADSSLDNSADKILSSFKLEQ